ncbi:MAG: hypothetical protein WCJ54_01625 [Actinomycetota bacterium]
MSENKEKCKKVDPKIVAYIAGGAVIGGVIGYIVNKVGLKNIARMLKDKNILSPEVSNFVENFDIKAFAAKTKKDFEDIED